MANLYIGLDEKAQAFLWLEKTYQERPNYLACLKVLPILDHFVPIEVSPISSATSALAQ